MLLISFARRSYRIDLRCSKWCSPWHMYTLATGSAYLGMGNLFQFQTIAAVALGGVTMSGGSGSYMGTVAGSMTIAVLLAVLTALNLSPALQQIFYGLILFVAILAATIQNNRKMSSKL